MRDTTRTPVHLNRLAAARFSVQMLRDPIAALDRSHAEFGPFAVIRNALPFTSRTKLAMLGRPLILTAGPEFNAEVLSNPTVWRTVSIFPGGPKGTSIRRLGAGLSRMTGRRHVHYRRLLSPPLRKASVEAMGDAMAELAEEDIAAWPVDTTIDLWEYVRQFMHTLGIGLLFNGDKEQGHPIAEMISRVLALKWSLAARACPINLPASPYRRLLEESDALERCILDWADKKRGHLDDKDLLSIIVNNPEEDGAPPRPETIVGHMPQLFGAAFETCQNVLIWTLVLLAQHPEIARNLLKELQDALADGPATLAKVGTLPQLDGVVKESLRLLPPVPIQMRVAQRETSLAGYPAPAGTRVMLNAVATNRVPYRYPDPHCFRPERWASIDPTPFEYLVFSAGPRNCPGYWLGNALVKVAIATFLRRYRIEWAPHARIDYMTRPALTPRAGIEAVLRRQDGQLKASPIRGTISSLVQWA